MAGVGFDAQDDRFFDALAACRRAVILVGSQDETRGSFRPVVSSTEGYFVPSTTC